MPPSTSSFKRRTPSAARSSSSSTASPNASSPVAAANTATTNTAAVAAPVVDDKVQSAAATGIKPAPYPSLVAHFSTGLASLDDVLTGSGLPSSSVLLLCPALHLANPLSLSPSSASGDRSDQSQKVQQRTLSDNSVVNLEAAEREVVWELAGYGIAQGIVSGHCNIVVAPSRLPGARSFVEQAVPAIATANSSSHHSVGASAETQKAVVEEDDREKEEEMVIAFRYAHRPKFKTTVEEPKQVESSKISTNAAMPSEYLYCAPFDRSKRWTSDALALAREDGRLVEVEATNSYDEVLQRIDAAIRQQQQQPHQKKRTIRIHLLSLGAEDWCNRSSKTHEQRLSETSRFLLQLRRMVKAVALEDGGLPCIATATVSPSLLCPPSARAAAGSVDKDSIRGPSSVTNNGPRAVQRTTLHMSRFVDAQVCLSSFSHTPTLARAFPSYGGALHLLKGPCIGAVLPPGESRSVLRGGLGEAGAENDVGWRQKKRGRGVVIETLHEDVDPPDPALEAEASKKKAEAVAAAPMGQARGRGAGDPSAKNDIEEAARGLQRRPLPHGNGNGKQAEKEQGHAHTYTHTHGDEGKGAKKPGTGLLSGLRARGLEARQRKQITVELEDGGSQEDKKGEQSKKDQGDW